MKTQLIDYGANADLPAHVRAAIPDEDMQSVFRATLNSHLRDGASEMHAYIKAYRSLETAGLERRDGKWVKKDSPTVSDVHVARPLGSDKKKPKLKDDPGADPADLDEFEEEAAVVGKRISGNSAIPLNEKGAKMAEELGKRLAAKGGIDVLYASPLKRAQQTAAAIVKEAPSGSLHLAAPIDALRPWRVGDMEGKQPGDVEDLIKHYVEHPDEVPPGEGADGEPAECFSAAVKRQLNFQSRLYSEFEESPEFKIGEIMHSRGMELLKSWVDDGQPKDYELKTEELLKPDDEPHASVLRWHKGEIDEVDLESDEPLKPGVYLILHSLTDDDTDSGNKELKKADEAAGGGTGQPGKEVVQKFMPPLEVFQDANLAWATGVSAEGITSELIEGKGLNEESIRKVAEWHAAVEAGAITPSDVEKNAWGGKHAKKWADRVVKKIEKERETLVMKAGNGVMLAFWPTPELAAKLAVAGGEKPEDLHVTLAYFGKLADVDMNVLPSLEAAVSRFAETHAPLPVELGGVGRFPATPSSDGKDVAYLGVHSPDIQKFRQDLVDACKGVGCEPKSNFGYNPHMTLKLVPPHAPHFLATPEKADVTFDEVVLSIGTAAKKYKLTGTPEPKVTKGDFELSGTIVSKDDAQHLVFGWFSIVKVGDRKLEDTQGDVITEETIEEAAYDFVLTARTGGEMHEKKGNGEVRGVGRVVESCVFTKEKQAAMLQSLHDQGIDAVLDLKCVGWWGGFKIENPDTWAKVTTGQLKAFSIGGRGKREKLEQ